MVYWSFILSSYDSTNIYYENTVGKPLPITIGLRVNLWILALVFLKKSYWWLWQVIFIKIFIYLFIWEWEWASEWARERVGVRGRGRNRISLEQGAKRRTWPQGPGIMTWAEGRRLTDWATQAPRDKLFLNERCGVENIPFFDFCDFPTFDFSFWRHIYLPLVSWLSGIQELPKSWLKDISIGCWKF